MVLLITGLVIFFGTHLFTAYARGARAALVERLGEMPYKGLYSLVSLAGFVLIVMGYKRAPTDLVYEAPSWGGWVTYSFSIVAFIMLTAAYLPAGKIKGWLGHPMAVGTGVFAAGHLAVNGDIRSVLVFGAFLAYAILDRISYRLRGDPGASPGPVLWDLAAVGGGLVSSYLVIQYLHRYLGGVGLNPGALMGG